jgi:hypothetical protein
MRAFGRNYYVDLGVVAFVLGAATTSKLVETTTGGLAFRFHLIGIMLLDHLAKELLVLGLIAMFGSATALVFLGQMLGAFVTSALFLMLHKGMCHYLPPSLLLSKDGLPSALGIPLSQLSGVLLS